MKIVSLSLLFQFTCIFLLAQHPIQNAIEAFVNDPSMVNASISFEVKDLKSATIIASYQPNLSLPTASTAKLFSTATALEILGPDYRAMTRVYYDGTIDSLGVLHGNIWIQGGGDPSIGSKYFNEEGHQLDFFNEWMASFQKLGIKKIDGDIIADASAFGYEGAPDGWNWSDLGNYYGAGPSGLTIYDNLVKYYFSVPSTPGMITNARKIEPEVPGLVYHNYVLSSTKSGDNCYLYGAPYSLDRFGTGTLPVGSSNFMVKGSLPDPEYQFAYELSECVKKYGIDLSGNPKSVRREEILVDYDFYSSKQLILSHDGERLMDIIYHTNTRSINLFAEHMLNLIGYEKSGDGSTKSGLKTFTEYWKNKINIQGLELNDGSGLSRTNAISASHFVEMLDDMQHSSNGQAFLSSLPVAGESGTLRNVCKGQAAHGHMKAKSGSMTRIKSYAGYIEGKNGSTYAFALIVNNYTCSSSALKQKMEKVFNQIALH